MAITISYKNNKGEPIDSKEKVCNVIYKEDGNVKKIEHVAYYSVFRVTYYMSDDESIINILNDINIDYVDIIKTTVIGNYKIEESTIYADKELYLMSKTLYDEFDHSICEQPCDIITKEAILNNIEKFINNDLDEIEIWFH